MAMTERTASRAAQTIRDYDFFIIVGWLALTVGCLGSLLIAAAGPGSSPEAIALATILP